MLNENVPPTLATQHSRAKKADRARSWEVWSASAEAEPTSRANGDLGRQEQKDKVKRHKNQGAVGGQAPDRLEEPAADHLPADDAGIEGKAKAKVCRGGHDGRCGPGRARR